MTTAGPLLHLQQLLREFYTVHSNMGAEQQKRSSGPRGGTKRARSATASSRHVLWSDTDRAPYCVVREGIAMEGREDADRLFERGELTEAHFYLFRHSDPEVERNASVPKYEAAYYFARTGEYARVKKCHLKVAYQRAGHTQHARIWDVDEATGVPYWVDRHAFSKMKQQKSKRKYEANKGKGSL